MNSERRTSNVEPATLEGLMERQQSPSVSVYMPTHRAGPDVRQNPVRFRNLVRAAEERLTGLGLRSSDAAQLLDPVRQISDEDPFWQHQEDGLAVFLAPGFSRWQVLPMTVDEQVLIGDRFHLKPLLPLFSGDGRFYLLALSQNGVRLFDCTRYRLVERSLDHVPSSLAEALRFDDPEEQLQYFGLTRTGTGAVFHGHGVGRDDVKERIQRYFHQVDHGIHQVLRAERAPLVLAGVEYELSIYRDLNSYPQLLRQTVAGNPDGLRPEELHRKALEIMTPHFAARQRGAATTYRSLAGTGLSSRDIREVVPAAFHGRIDRLFVSMDDRVWGRFDHPTAAVQTREEPEPGDDELLDLAAVRTLLAGGAVFAVARQEMPDDSEVAAIFRY